MEEARELTQQRLKTIEKTSRLIKIKIRTLDQSQFEVQVPQDIVVRDLKQLIQQKQNVQIQNQRIIFQGRLLKNQDSLNMFKIEDGHVLQLVTKQPEEASQRQNQNENSGLFNLEDGSQDEFIAGILRQALEPNQRRRRDNRSQLQQQRQVDSQESLETIRQSLWTIQQIFSSMNGNEQCLELNGNQTLIQPFDSNKKQFQVGQWVDVKDTVDQWLEAQVTQIRNDVDGQKCYVHYNGWPNHWDEWIESNNSRITPFRTHTVQSSNCPFLSPSPTINPDFNMQQQQVNNSQGIQQNNQQIINEPNAFRSSNNQTQELSPLELIGQITDLMTESKHLLDRLYTLHTIQKHEKAQENIQPIQERSNILHGIEERKIKEEEDTLSKQSQSSNSFYDANSVEFQPQSNQSTVYQNCQPLIQKQLNLLSPEHEILLLSAQLCPVLDRLGRLLADLAPHTAINARNSNNQNLGVSQEFSVMQSPGELSRPLEGNVDIFIHAVISPSREENNQQNGNQQEARQDEQYPMPLIPNLQHISQQQLNEIEEEETEIDSIYQTQENIEIFNSEVLNLSEQNEATNQNIQNNQSKEQNQESKIIKKQNFQQRESQPEELNVWESCGMIEEEAQIQQIRSFEEKFSSIALQQNKNQEDLNSQKGKKQKQILSYIDNEVKGQPEIPDKKDSCQIY